MKKIVYRRADSGISVLHPMAKEVVGKILPEVLVMTDDEYLEFIKDKDVPKDALEIVFLEDSDIPDDRENSRAFWDLKDGKIIVTKTDEEIAKYQAQKNFNTNTFLIGLDGILGNLSNFALRLEGGNISRFCDANNFQGLKQYLQLLISNGIAVQDDYSKINTIAKQQNVDLDNL